MTMLTSPRVLGVLISGRGSNLQSIMAAARAGRVPATIAVVISNRADAAGLARAREAGIDALVMPHRDYPSREAYDRALVDALRSRHVTFVCLAGFMRLLGPAFCAAFPDAIVNIHPSLLPAFPGVDAPAQAIAHRATVSGATVHLVTPDLDAGPIVLQRRVPVHAGDTAETLAARILVEEHELYPEALRMLFTQAWHVDGGRVVFDDTRLNPAPS